MVLLLKGPRVIWRTVSVFLRIVRNSADRKPIRNTCDADQKVIRSSTNGVYEVEYTKM